MIFNDQSYEHYLPPEEKKKARTLPGEKGVMACEALDVNRLYHVRPGVVSSFGNLKLQRNPMNYRKDSISLNHP